MQAGASLKKNTANDNVDIGIDAVVGTIDLGGNTATGQRDATASGWSARLPRSAPAERPRYR